MVNGKVEKQLGWYPNGKKEREFNYKNGRPHGQFSGYFEDGVTKYFEENYNNGIQEGMQYGWNSDGTLRYQEQRLGGAVISRFDYEKKGEWPKRHGC